MNDSFYIALSVDTDKEIVNLISANPDRDLALANARERIAGDLKTLNVEAFNLADPSFAANLFAFFQKNGIPIEESKRLIKDFADTLREMIE